MFDIKDIEENLDKYIIGLKRRNISDSKAILENILKLNDERKKYKIKKDHLLSKIKDYSDKIGNFLKNNVSKPTSESAHTVTLENIKKDVIKYKEKLKKISQSYNNLNTEIHKLLFQLPNIPNSRVPTEEQGNTITNESDIPKYKKKLLPHWELAKRYNLIDFELGNKIAGPGFPVYKGQMAKLQRALVSYFLDQATKAGYEEVQVPVLVNQDSVFGTGQLPDKEDMMYKLERDNLYLIPTAEIPITNIVRDKILNESELPLKYVGHSINFRREAGSWGSHVRGLNRLHQFDKVEIVQVQHPSKSSEALEGMTKHIETLLQSLKLPFRRLFLNESDLGFTSSITYDLEVFSPGQDKWLEVSSISNFETFQSNRLKLRVRCTSSNSKIKPHTLNGSALALPRTIAALLENNQCNEGIKIPEVLIPYTGFSMITG